MINTKETPVATLSTRGDYPSNSYRARKIWELLYRNTGAKEFKSFDNFLIDLKCFQEQLDSQSNHNIVEFYWSYSDWGNHTKTAVFTENWKLIDLWEHSYAIRFDRDKQVITINEVHVIESEDDR